MQGTPACPLLKQTRRLSITAHSDQSQSCLFKSSSPRCAFILHHGLFRSIFTTTVIATNQEGKVNGMGLTPTLKNLTLLSTSAKFTAKKFTCRPCTNKGNGDDISRCILSAELV